MEFSEFGEFAIQIIAENGRSRVEFGEKNSNVFSNIQDFVTCIMFMWYVNLSAEKYILMFLRNNVRCVMYWIH